MKAIGYRLDDRVQNRAIPTAKLGAVRICLNFEFFDGVDRRLNYVRLASQNVAEIGIVIDTVEQVVVLQSASAI